MTLSGNLFRNTYWILRICILGVKFQKRCPGKQPWSELPVQSIGCIIREPNRMVAAGPLYA
jgi:hypothetical protein